MNVRRAARCVARRFDPAALYPQRNADCAGIGTGSLSTTTAVP
jgi:hypothetical protein